MKVASRIVLISFSIAVLMTGFANCSKVGFVQGEGSLIGLSVFDVFSAETHAQTKKNKPVDFELASLKKVGRVSFAESSDQTRIVTANGVFEVINPATFLIKYTPNASFVGLDTVPVFVRDNNNLALPSNIVVTVGNIISHLQPAMAVRGVSCLACHANVSSNVLTDLGYGPNAQDRTFYLNAHNWKNAKIWSSGFYGEHGGSVIAGMNLAGTAKFIIPQAPIPADLQPAAKMGSATLKDYVSRALASSTFASTRTVSVLEAKSVKISLPSAARLREVFGNPAGNMVYERDTQASPQLAGVAYDATRKSFTITDMTCDGDLLLDGSVVFRDAKVRSVNGCRIYATGSIFVDKDLKSMAYDGSSSQHNIQLISAVSVWLGVGEMYKNGSHCDPGSWMTSNEAAETNSMNVRFKFMDNYGASTRAANPTQMIATIRAELPGVMPLEDASCSAPGRARVFSRLLVAAPWVNSRFKGDFNGAIIAETSLMSLGSFIFSFDPVFQSASVLPKLDETELLDVQP